MVYQNDVQSEHGKNGELFTALEMRLSFQMSSLCGFDGWDKSDKPHA